MPGFVTLVGAGPAGPELLTLAGKEALAQAECILYDRLIDPAILLFAPRSADRIYVGKQAGATSHYIEQAEINALLVAKAQAGLRVVRLKGGDPLMFARGGEELTALAEAGIPYRVIPGVTAALAAAAALGVSLTHRDAASAVAFFTGHVKPEQLGQLDLAGLARFPGTLVGYMPLAQRRAIAQGLIAHGRGAETPVAFVEWAATSRQRTIRTTLGAIANDDPAGDLESPAVAIVGRALTLQTPQPIGPLSGLRILSLRPMGTDAELARRLADLGAAVYSAPAFDISPPTDWTAVDAALRSLDRTAWVAFASRHAVDMFLARAWEIGLDARAFANVRFAAIGAETARALEAHRFRADHVPTVADAVGLADELGPNVRGARVLLPRADRGKTVLEERLTAAGAHVEALVAYRQVERAAPPADIGRLLADGKLDWAVVTSGNAGRALVRWLAEIPQTRRPRSLSIGRNTTADLAADGVAIDAEAREPTTDGLIAALLEAV